MRAVVVGGGIHGQVITWRLAAGGIDVVHVEEVAAGHAGSASGDRSRIVRALYGEDRFVESGARSLALFRAWEEELGTSLVDWLGVLYLVRDADTEGDRAFARYVEAGTRSLTARGISFEPLTADEIGRRYPGIRPQGLSHGVLEPGGGAGLARKATRTIARAALRTGRVDAITARAIGLCTEGDRVTGVTVDDGGAPRTLEGDVVVLAAGFGGVRLLASAGVALDVRSISHFVAYFDVPLPEAATLAAPALVPFAELGSGLYGFPDDGEAGFKVAWHEPLRAHDDQGTGAPSETQIEALRIAASVRFPALARARCRSTFTCAYDATPDEGFLIGWVPGFRSLYFVGGMSGHGYKHAPAVGEAVAATLTGTHDPERHLDLASYALPHRAPRA